MIMEEKCNFMENYASFIDCPLDIDDALLKKDRHKARRYLSMKKEKEANKKIADLLLLKVEKAHKDLSLEEVVYVGGQSIIHYRFSNEVWILEKKLSNALKKVARYH